MGCRKIGQAEPDMQVCALVISYLRFRFASYFPYPSPGFHCVGLRCANPTYVSKQIRSSTVTPPPMAALSFGNAASHGGAFICAGLRYTLTQPTFQLHILFPLFFPGFACYLRRRGRRRYPFSLNFHVRHSLTCDGGSPWPH